MIPSMVDGKNDQRDYKLLIKFLLQETHEEPFPLTIIITTINTIDSKWAGPHNHHYSSSLGWFPQLFRP